MISHFIWLIAPIVIFAAILVFQRQAGGRGGMSALVGLFAVCLAATVFLALS